MSTKSRSVKRRYVVGEADEFARLNRSLEQIAQCLAFVALQMSDFRDKADIERIPFLDRFGFRREEIANILGTTPNTVSKQLSIRRRQRTETGSAKRANLGHVTKASGSELSQK